ncbi:carbon-nitrogen hydrolase family protein [Spongiibacter tropicus]|uniref:carbon-nitrogen hydrolase family protein n=1 Tax=Spongiibacter tropicus TaxID=454602 RepID=UPI0003B5EA48|nr:carbon-nitrogen hydrolase family protein [Spongiibacter tropicus]
MTNRFAAIQMVSGRSLDENLETAARLLKQAAEQGAELAVLPENFALMAPTESIQALAQHEQQASQLRHFLADQAASLKLWLLGGTLPLPADDGRSYAASLAYDSDGVCRAEYHKIHLFDADVGDAQQQYRESDSYAPGDQPCVFDSPFGRIGVAVCYDLRFPELFRQMMDPGMDVLLVPAAFTRRTGLAHWLPLLRARAIENQIAVVAANQGGIHSRRRQTSGGSCIIDSWGTVLSEMGFGEGVALADIDLAEQQALRQRMPVMQHRRF